MEKKKICWITADYFADCEFVPLKEVSKVYEIFWIISFTRRPRYLESDFEQFRKENPNIKIFFYHQKCRIRGLDPMSIIDFHNISSLALSINADYYYLNMSMTGLWSFYLWNKLKKEKIIITSHQGKVHDGFKMKTIARLSRKYVYGSAKIVNMFSKSQAALFKEEFPQSQVVMTNLALKDFGNPTVVPTNDDGIVRFLSFGIINYGKHIDLLIDAACLLYERGIRNFKITITGKCANWDFYRQRIKYPEMFECDIRMIPNSEIPNLFANTHYFVQPYRIVTQSGPMKIAFNYNVPVIVSDLPGFTDELEDGINGYCFKTESVEDLARVLVQVIKRFGKDYSRLKANMAEYTKAHYSNAAIGMKYIEMFNMLDK